MGKYSFGQYADDYMTSLSGVYADETIRTRRRRYARIERNLIILKEENKISTTSPKLLTVDDVKTFIVFRKSKVSPEDVVQDINALKKLCDYLENPAVGICVSKYYGLRPVIRARNRLPTMPDQMYNAILDRAMKGISWDDYEKVSSYALVLLYLNTGARNKEIRLADIRDLDTQNWVLSLVHVKGEASYGQPRSVPIRPEIRELIKRYISLREKWVVDNNLTSPALFPSRNNRYGGYLSSNGVRRIKEKVEKDLNIKFDLRMCRRTFGQRYMDSGLTLEATSVLMGHSSTKTTEAFYSRKRLEYAVKEAQSTWSGGVESHKFAGE